MLGLRLRGEEGNMLSMDYIGIRLPYSLLTTSKKRKSWRSSQALKEPENPSEAWGGGGMWRSKKLG